MNLNKIFYDWSNEVYVDRNRLVFEDRNQAYGAFQIRQAYNKILIKSMFIATLFISSLIAIPALLSYLKSLHPIARVLPPDDGPIVIPPDEIYKVIEKPKETLSTIKPQNTVEHVVPKVVNEVVKTPISIAVTGTLDSANAGKITSKGGELLAFVNVKPKEKEPEPKEVEATTYAEIMPEFIGGDEALLKFMRDNVRYPNLEKEAGISGTVYVNFIVNKSGKVENANVVRGVKGGKGLDEEALRVMSKMPLWKPGMQNKQPVKVQYTYPVKFVLQ